MDAHLLINPHGGSVSGDTADELRSALAAAGVDATVEEVDGPSLADRAKALVDAKAALVIAAGGDGTISAVAGALAGSDTALGVMPLGTLNHFARDLGIPANAAGAAAVIAAGHRMRVDVAELNGRTFINNSAIGLYPLMVIDRESQQKRLGRSKKLAMLVASLRTLARFHDHRLTLRVNGAAEGSLDTPLLFVGNNDYEVALPAAGARRSLSDGRLCVFVMRKKGVLGLIAASLRALVGLTRSDDMIRLDDVQSLEVEGRRPHIMVSLDGETTAMASPLRYRIRKADLAVLAPPAA
ncbi:diacylglycerol/lipid kinase family protein [Sphingomonas jaspsi]|uniref:diacylglycerol/lipid kinase family protein n=1 Tax=Sphingomonas jaspsi TaxID=392409 RepID=UPI00055CE927|nr:diacylglycerol kinase family protein [Sphingomonas jaspsi]